jgi:hypothetical protein
MHLFSEGCFLAANNHMLRHMLRTCAAYVTLQQHFCQVLFFTFVQAPLPSMNGQHQHQASTQRYERLQKHECAAASPAAPRRDILLAQQQGAPAAAAAATRTAVCASHPWLLDCCFQDSCLLLLLWPAAQPVLFHPLRQMLLSVA